VPDPSSSSFHNAIRARASSLPGAPILPTPSNLAFHDLTDGQIAPKAAKSLLGLGSKFIVTPRKTTGSLEATSDRFQRDFFIKIIFAGGDEPDLADDTPKRSKLYVKSDWNPTECDVPNWACLRLSRFLTRTQRLFRERRAQSNLMPHQEALLKSLREDPLLLYPETDKGLGPCSVTFDQYVEDCLIHLRNQQCYTRLSEDEAMTEVALLEDKIEQWLDKYELTIGKMATKYIRKHLGANRKSPFGQFYILYKIHKEKKNDRWSTRPVCSDVTSLTHAVGKWVNEMLAPIQQAQESYFQDSFALKKLLDEMEVPPNALLFTSDATAMYTNIRTEPALEKISEYLRENAKAFKHSTFDTEALIAALHLVFENNLFKLGDTFWKQILGTAMGTPPAPPWATIFFALKEMGLLPKWSTFLHFYKRFIDDVLGVWLVHPDPEYNKKMWLEFQADMNSWFGLEWVCTDLATSVNFMDLTITIADGHLETTLFEKAQNLYLYIPPHSSHPRGVFTGLIFGQVLRIRRLCSKQSDADDRTKQFFARLLARGHTHEFLRPLFQRAEVNAASYLSRNSEEHDRLRISKEAKSSDQVFFHLQFHPDDPPSRDIQSIWREQVSHPPGEAPLNTLKNLNKCEVGFSKLVVAYSRPLNLRNRFTVRDIHNRGRPVSEYLVE
jgi:hypothetical protein